MNRAGATIQMKYTLAVLVGVAALGVVTAVPTVLGREPPAYDMAAGISSQFLQLAKALSLAIQQNASPHHMLEMLLKATQDLENSLKEQQLAQSASGSGVEVAKCANACPLGQCCLQKPNDPNGPSCQVMPLASKKCSKEWRNHYTGQNPDSQTALVGETCPCAIGNLCSWDTTRDTGACSHM